MIADVAGDWKCVNADALVAVTVEEVDADTGPADADTKAESVPALQWDEQSGPVAVGDGGELSATTCRFELAVIDVGFTVRQRVRVTDPTGRVWVLDRVRTDASGSLYLCEATLTRSDS